MRMQIKTTRRYHYSPTRTAKIQAPSSPNAGALVAAGGKAKWCSHLGRQRGVFYETKHTLTTESSNVLLGVYPEESKTYVHINTQMFIAASSIIAKLGSNRVSLEVSR